MRSLLEEISEMVGVIELEKVAIAARLPAEKGWFVVLSEPTDMKDPDCPLENARYHRIHVLPIEEWGIPDPMFEPSSAEAMMELADPIKSLASMFSPSVPKKESVRDWLKELPSILPIDSRTGDKFVPLKQLWATYPPGSGTAQEILRKVETDFADINKALATMKAEKAPVPDGKRDDES